MEDKEHIENSVKLNSEIKDWFEKELKLLNIKTRQTEGNFTLIETSEEEIIEEFLTFEIEEEIEVTMEVEEMEEIQETFSFTPMLMVFEEEEIMEEEIVMEEEVAAAAIKKVPASILSGITL